MNTQFSAMFMAMFNVNHPRGVYRIPTIIENMINKKTLLLLLLLFSTTVFAQQDKSLKFGIELDGKLKKADLNTHFDSPTGVVSLGAFAEL